MLAPRCHRPRLLETGSLSHLIGGSGRADFRIRPWIGETGGAMFVLHRAGRWLADLLERFDDALIALDHDVDTPAG